MATPPTFSAGAVLTAAQMNAVGLWEIKAETVGTGVATVTLSSVFSADYENYLVIVSGVDTNSAGDLRLTFGATAANYYGSMYNDTSAGVTTTTRVNNGAYINAGKLGQSADTFVSMEIYRPNVAVRTGVTGKYACDTSNSGWFSGTLADVTAYTAFTLTASAGTMTGGVIRVYGYRN